MSRSSPVDHSFGRGLGAFLPLRPNPAAHSFLDQTDSRDQAEGSRQSVLLGVDLHAGEVDLDRNSTGTTWEDSYRFDPEQAGSGNTVPTTAKLLFQESGNASMGNVGQAS